MIRISRYFPLPRGKPRVDDRRVVSGIIYVIRNGLQWKDAPKACGPHKTLYNRFARWSALGVFDRIFQNLASEGSNRKRIMIDSTHLRAHRTAANLLKKGRSPRLIGRTKGVLNSKLHAVTRSRWQARRPASHRRPDERPYGSENPLSHAARRRGSDCRQRLRQR